MMAAGLDRQDHSGNANDRDSDDAAAAALADAEARAEAARDRRRARSKSRDARSKSRDSRRGDRRRSKSRDGRSMSRDDDGDNASASASVRSMQHRRSDRARSRSRERVQELEREIEQAEQKARAAKERRRARSVSRERSFDIELALDGDGGDDGGGAGGDAASGRFDRSLRSSRARSKSRERAAGLARELERVEAAKEMKQQEGGDEGSGSNRRESRGSRSSTGRAAAAAARRARSRSIDRMRTLEQKQREKKERGRDLNASTTADARSRDADTNASEAWDDFDANAELPKRPPPTTLETSNSGGNRPASQINIYQSMGAISAISGGSGSRDGDTNASEAWDDFDANAELPKPPPPVTLEPSKSGGNRPASQINIYQSMGAISAISDVSGSSETEDMTDESGNPYTTTTNNNKRKAIAPTGSGGRQQLGSNPNSPPPNLHTSLANSDWSAFHRALQHLAQTPSLIVPSATMPDPSSDNPNDGTVGTTTTTPLHTACWKAPPTLALMLIRLLPSGSRQVSGMVAARDQDGNTPLHLHVANLERMPGSGGDAAANDGSGGGGGINTSVLEALLRAAPRAVKMQNSEGDTPLHMLVSSPVALPKSWDLPPDSREYDAAGASAERALGLLLNSSGGRDSALMKDMTGATPVHVAIASGAHGAVVDRLIDAAPQALKVADNRGMLPMHYVAAFCHTPASSVKRMLQRYPEALFAHTTNGDTPLHLLVSNSSNNVGKREDRSGGNKYERLDSNMISIIKLLMGPTDSESVPLVMTNREKLTPLHCCALFDAPPELSRLLMTHSAAKQASAMSNSFGATPLHLSSAQPGVAESLATVLAVGTPAAAAVKDRLKRTPLHVASQNVHATPDLITALAKLYPSATTEKTQRGHLPLHLAGQSQAKESVIKALIRENPSAAKARNKSSNTPLHDAAKYKASPGAVKLLLDAYTDAVYIQNQYGNLPLHCATAYQAPKEVISMLFNAHPRGASTPNRNKDLPLHYAAAYATSPEGILPLINAAPEALFSVNSSGQTPIERAQANDAPKEIIDLLEKCARKAKASGKDA